MPYKIFDVKDDSPHTLFHGVKGSRRLSIGRWLTAERKMVRDGSGQNRYISGFHAYETMEDVKAWVKGARNLAGRVVSKVQVRGCRNKPRAVRRTILAYRMRIDQGDWDNRISLEVVGA